MANAPGFARPWWRNSLVTTLALALAAWLVWLAGLAALQARCNETGSPAVRPLCHDANADGPGASGLRAWPHCRRAATRPAPRRCAFLCHGAAADRHGSYA